MPLRFARQVTTSLRGEDCRLLHPDSADWHDAFRAASASLKRLWITDDGLFPEFGHDHLVECAHCDTVVFAPTEALAIDLLETHEHDTHDIEISIPSLRAYQQYRQADPFQL